MTVKYSVDAEKERMVGGMGCWKSCIVARGVSEGFEWMRRSECGETGWGDRMGRLDGKEVRSTASAVPSIRQTVADGR